MPAVGAPVELDVEQRFHREAIMSAHRFAQGVQDCIGPVVLCAGRAATL